MAREALGVFVVLLILALIGLGPALWLTASGEKRLAYALGIAPALGYALIALAAFPLARYVSPVQGWAWPATAVLILVSLGLMAADWRRNREAYRAFRGWPGVMGAGVWVAVGCLILVGPLFVRGMQYAAFRANAADVFLPVSLAEALRFVEWKTFVAGATFVPANLENVRRLAEASPAALFAAKALPVPLALNSWSAIAWAASLLGLPVYRYYHVHQLLCFALALPSTLVLGSLLKLSPPLKYLAAAAVAFGFWAKFVLDSDAGHQVSAQPIMLLAVFAWIQLEQAEPGRRFSRSRLLLALALAAVWAVYFPFAPILVIAFACYYGWAWLQGARPLAAGLWHGLTLALAALMLTLSGQMDWIVRNNLYLALNAGAEAQYPPYVLWLMKANDVSAVWGLPGSVLWQDLASLNLRWLLQNLAGGLGVFLTVSLVITVAFIVRRSAPLAERIVLAVLVGGAALGLVSGVLNNSRAAGKAFTYVYPYFILTAAVFPHYAGRILKPPLHRLAPVLIGAWLATQFGLGFILPYNDRVADTLGGKPKAESYDLSPITSYLDAHPPEQLLVMIPRSIVWSADTQYPNEPKGWAFAFYSQVAFSTYRPYYQSGLVIDNSFQMQNLWLQELTRPPDYAVILKAVDYIGPAGLGTKVAETPDLALYHLTSGELAFFRQAEHRLFAEREGATECYEGFCSPPG